MEELRSLTPPTFGHREVPVYINMFFMFSRDLKRIQNCMPRSKWDMVIEALAYSFPKTYHTRKKIGFKAEKPVLKNKPEMETLMKIHLSVIFVIFPQ